MGVISGKLKVLDARGLTAFRRSVLVGCEALTVNDLRQLADDIHQIARDRHEADCSPWLDDVAAETRRSA